MAPKPRSSYRAAFVVGALFLAALLTTAVASLGCSVTMTGCPFWLQAELRGGAVEVLWTVPDPSGARSGFGNPGWRIQWRGSAPRLAPSYSRGASFGQLLVPLWMPALAVAAPTVIAWRRARSATPGACVACGYDMTGLGGAKCPECGRAWRSTLVGRLVEAVLARSGRVC